MYTRREALALAGATLTSSLGSSAVADTPKKRLAGVNSIYYKLSHAYHIEGRLVYGYNVKGKHHQPPFTLARIWNDQSNASGAQADLTKPLVAKGVQVSKTIAETLGGRETMDVDGVLLICEHGNYPRNANAQILYPRFEFFQQIVEVMQASKKFVPLFIDKHFSFNHVKARQMYDTTKKLGIPLMAGSSLPVTWRRPEYEPPFGAKIREAVVCFYADLEIYGFHALEVLQCLMERRAGGETGVKSVSAIKGAAVWNAWDNGAWSKELAEAALRRSGSRDFGTPRDHVENPVAIQVEYRDGAKATLLHLPGYVADLTAAVKIDGDPKPHAMWFVLPMPPGARFFDPLTYYIEEFFTTGKAPYPAERTLLTSTMLDFAMRSAASGGTVFTHDISMFATNRVTARSSSVATSAMIKSARGGYTPTIRPSAPATPPRPPVSTGRVAVCVSRLA